jgi:mannose-6-phosphate isomerase-like protein (cupin superfamily)
MVHEDERRILEDWPEAKLITAKADCVLGNHYHKIKTEKFILSTGYAIISIDGAISHMTIGKIYTVRPMAVHSFEIKKDSLLIGLCSHAFDHTDDYKI